MRSRFGGFWRCFGSRRAFSWQGVKVGLKLAFKWIANSRGMMT